MPLFNVTYAIVTEESAKDGEAVDHGFLAEDVSLREAIDLIGSTRTSRVDGVDCVECNEYPVIAPRWITVYNNMEYETGAFEQRSLHIPPEVTPASRRRIARLLGALS